MAKCENCGSRVLPVTNDQIDSLMASHYGESAWWWLPDETDAKIVRGRVYYSARIHNTNITTSYRDGYLKVKVVA